jgi:hypothetical protein
MVKEAFERHNLDWRYYCCNYGPVGGFHRHPQGERERAR